MSNQAPKIALFPGSFDPWTNGHMFLLKKGLAIFDNVIVVVAVNPQKTYMFESWERVNMIRDVVRRSLPADQAYRVKVIETDTYVGECGVKYGANFFLRGIRNADDAEWEMEVAETNQKLFPEMHTVILPAPSSMSWMSSSVVKWLADRGDSFSMLVHPDIEAMIKLRMEQNEKNSTP